MNPVIKVEGEQALAAKAWPFEEARKLLARIEARGRAGQMVKGVLFETGYGPSGLPHIGTFGEVARTSWAFSLRRWTLSSNRRAMPWQ